MVEGTESIRQDIDAIRGSMTDTMEQIESRVKGTVDTTVEHVKRTFDVKQHIADQPWAALGVAVAAGYVLGSLDGGNETSQSVRQYSSDVSDKAHAAQATNGSTPRKPGFLEEIMDQFGDEINMLTSAGVAMGVSMLRDAIQQNLPQLGKTYQKLYQQRNTSSSLGRETYAATPAPTTPNRTYETREAMSSPLNGGVS